MPEFFFWPVRPSVPRPRSSWPASQVVAACGSVVSCRQGPPAKSFPVRRKKKKKGPLPQHSGISGVQAPGSCSSRRAAPAPSPEAALSRSPSQPPPGSAARVGAGFYARPWPALMFPTRRRRTGCRVGQVILYAPDPRSASSRRPRPPEPTSGHCRAAAVADPAGHTFPRSISSLVRVLIAVNMSGGSRAHCPGRAFPPRRAARTGGTGIRSGAAPCLATFHALANHPTHRDLNARQLSDRAATPVRTGRRRTPPRPASKTVSATGPEPPGRCHEREVRAPPSAPSLKRRGPTDRRHHARVLASSARTRQGARAASAAVGRDRRAVSPARAGRDPSREPAHFPPQPGQGKSKEGRLFICTWSPALSSIVVGFWLGGGGGAVIMLHRERNTCFI